MLEKENPLVSVSAQEINQTPIKKRLVRVVWESPGKGKRKNKKLSMLLTTRPEWSNFGAGEKALAGGKFRREDYNYTADPNDCSIAEHIKAAKIAMCREILEEFSVDITPDQLKLVDIVANTSNDLGYINFVFYLKSEQRPELKLNEENDAIEWILSKLVKRWAELQTKKWYPAYEWIMREIFKDSGKKLFADHPYLIKIVLESLAGEEE